MNTLINKNLNLGVESKQLANQYYFIPHPYLKPYISHYTFIHAPIKKSDDLKPEKVHIIPDGSGCLIFEFGNKDIKSCCWGPTSEVAQVERNSLDTGEMMFFIEFLPGGLRAISGINQQELKDLKCEGVDVSKDLIWSLEECVKRVNSIEGMIKDIEALILTYMENKSKKILKAYPIIYDINRNKGRAIVSELARKHYISERQLRRIISRDIGLGIKEYARIVKINNIIKLFKTSNRQSIYTIIDESYHDDSHFIKDFKELVGYTPSQYIKRMSDFYNEPYKY